MKAEERGRALLVRALIEQIRQEVRDDHMDCRFVGPLAVRLTDAILKKHLMVINGGAYEIRSVKPTNEYPPRVIEVEVVTENQMVCVWCHRPYRLGDSGARHKLCSSCWENGPCNEDLEV